MNKSEYSNLDIAKHYAATRPAPPTSLISAVIDFLRQKQDAGNSKPLKLCVDVGCGSGQNTTLYANHFQQVIGLDTSPDQLAAARTKNTYPNVVYQEASADDMPFEDASVDLITCCEAIHWFNIEAFFSEARRVLRPGGVLAVCGYWIPSILYEGKDLGYIIDEMFCSWEEVWIPGIHYLRDNYANLPNLFQEQVMIRASEGKFLVEREGIINNIKKVILSLVLYWRARNKYGQQKTDQDVESAISRIKEAMGSKNDQQPVKIQFSYFLRMWHKPSN